MCDRVVCDGGGLPNVFLFIYVCILFLLADLLFDTKDCIIYFSLPRKVDCVAINPLILHTVSQRRKVWQQVPPLIHDVSRVECAGGRACVAINSLHFAYCKPL